MVVVEPIVYELRKFRQSEGWHLIRHPLVKSWDMVRLRVLTHVCCVMHYSWRNKAGVYIRDA